MWRPLLAAASVLACLNLAAALSSAHDDGKDLDHSAPGGIDGAGPFSSSSRVQFLSQMTISQMGGSTNLLNNDIWGWTDPETGKDYALVGRYNGTSFVDVSDPTNPVFIADLRSHGGVGRVWRDIKVYDNHAYIVADNTNHGLQIFDLTKLRTTTPGTVFSATYADPNNSQPGDFLWRHSSFTSAHNIAINEETGYAYVVGSLGNSSSGGLHILDLSTPYNPTVAGQFAGDGYTHDTQVVVYHGPDEAYQNKEIAFSANADSLTITNVDVKSATSMIAKRFYTPLGYTHQGWLTEDHKYFLMGDETDERNSGTGTLTRTHIFNVEDLNNPIHLGYYRGTVSTSDHNLYIHQGLIYEANYESGLRVLEPVNLQSAELHEIGYLDTYASGDNISFNGAWSVYPFFQSGTIIVNDRQNGLFVARLLKGDTDNDGDVDNSDMLTAIGNFTGSGAIVGAPKLFADGSFDGDGDVDNTDLLNAIGSFTGSGGGSTAAISTQFSLTAGNLTDRPDHADLIYDPETGNLKIDPSEGPGGLLTGYVLQSDGEFSFENHMTSLNGQVDSTADEISESNSSSTLTSTIDLGDVLATGLTLEELEQLLTTANYTGQLGTGVNELDLIVVPEPYSITLLVVGVLLLGWRFRRRR